MNDNEDLWSELYFYPINLYTVWPTDDMIALDWEYRTDKDLIMEENVDGHNTNTET